jgi:hypothetical protein
LNAPFLILAKAVAIKNSIVNFGRQIFDPRLTDSIHASLLVFTTPALLVEIIHGTIVDKII